MKQEIKVILKYILSATSSFLIDIGLFTLFNFLLFFLGDISIIIATIIARIISSLYNYFINSRVVFKSYNKKSIYQYYVLVVVQMFVSALGVYLLNKVFININDSLIKIMVDTFIFIINYYIQKKIIFKNAR